MSIIPVNAINENGVAVTLAIVFCKSTDTKPTSYGEGSLCMETNTGKKFAFNGSTWTEI